MAVLVTHGVPVDTRTAEGETSLHIAARFGRLDVIAFLASHGADPNATDSHGDTPLDDALSARQEQTAELLVRRFGNRLAPAKPRVNEPVQVTVRPEPSR
jgi:ankyrin repeat protein